MVVRGNRAGGGRRPRQASCHQLATALAAAGHGFVVHHPSAPRHRPEHAPWPFDATESPKTYGLSPPPRTTRV